MLNPPMVRLSPDVCSYLFLDTDPLTQIYGPVLANASTPEQLTGTPRTWYDTVLDTPLDRAKEELGLASSNGWVDVRDVAEAIARVLERDEAGGERIIVSAGTFVVCTSEQRDALR